MKKTKKITALLLAGLMSVSVLTACGEKDEYKEKYESLLSQMESSNGHGSAVSESSAVDDESAESSESSENDESSSISESTGFDTSGTIKETVIYDENSIKITAKQLAYTSDRAEMSLLIENNGRNEIGVYSGTMGFSCTAINDYMIEDGYMNTKLSSGKKSNETVTFAYDTLNEVGIEGIGKIDFGFYIEDENNDGKIIFTGYKTIKTTQFDKYKDSKPSMEAFANNDSKLKEKGLTKKRFSKDKLYNEKSISVCSTLFASKDGEDILYIEMENNSNQAIRASACDVAIDDITVSSGSWTSINMIPGTKGYFDIEINSVVDESEKNIVDINSIGTISFVLKVYKSQSDDKYSEPKTVNVKVSDNGKSNTFENAIYDKNGIKIAPKGVANDEWESSDDLHLMFAIQNNYSKDIYVSLKDGSLSVNGFMIDEITWGQDISKGKTGILDVEMQDSSLKKNNIKSVSDVKQAELIVEISDGQYGIIDTVTLTVYYN